ncbi:hypothetical protein [Serinibacter arcticus]|uniref:Uncharacterized protein n=1 Tax=Serinibacter arcticus TaxID=1655435 RepID=A0A4Z1E0V4_9MICO|nr:hypothetical protein [Serinibacter arcticus]TGO04980.1 hypothetical protein SERN_0984 [Serinibacter arcticus]
MADVRTTSDDEWVVGGHRWTVTERADESRCYDIAWVSGPDPSYGFTLASSTRTPIDDAVIRREIVHVLGGVDPETGHLSRVRDVSS